MTSATHPPLATEPRDVLEAASRAKEHHHGRAILRRRLRYLPRDGRATYRGPAEALWRRLAPDQTARLWESVDSRSPGHRRHELHRFHHHAHDDARCRVGHLRGTAWTRSRHADAGRSAG